MNRYVDGIVAKQIVDTVKDVCGQDVNFIDQSGIIFASTDPSRVGTFHEIGHRAAVSGAAMEVTADDSYRGTRAGINLPVYYHYEFIAVIGITGEPDEVRKYAHLAEQITKLLVRERQLSEVNRTLDDKRRFVVDALIRDVTAVNIDYLNECLASFGFTPQSKARLVIMQTTHNTPMFEAAVRDLLDDMEAPLRTFYYPNEHFAVIESDACAKAASLLRRFADGHRDTVKIAVGSACDIHALAQSHFAARIALRALAAGAPGNFVCYDDLTLEIVLSSMDFGAKGQFIAKTVAALSEEQRELLGLYFAENQSLADTSRKLFIHKNTLQYKLNAIAEATGLNPRRFDDAVLLYLGLRASR